MFKEVEVPIKAKFAQETAAPQQESLAGSSFEKEESLDPVYEKELLPLLKIFSPSSAELGDFTEEVLSELKVQAERLQDLEGRSTLSLEKSVEDMKSLLLLKAREIIANFDAQDWKVAESGKGVDANLYKKAKICLLRAGDFSDWNKTRPNQIINGNQEDFAKISADSLAYHLNINTYFGGQDKEGLIRLNALETEALSEVGFDKQLVELASSHTNYSFSEISDTLLQKMIIAQKEGKIHHIDFETCLRRTPPAGGYSTQTMEEMAKNGYGGYVFSDCESFADSNKPEFWEKLTTLKNPGYPYHLDDALQAIKYAKLSPEDKKSAIASAFRHNFLTSRKFYGYIEDEPLRDQYFEMANMPFLYQPDSRKTVEPAALDEGQLRKIKELVADGYLGMFYDEDKRKYLNYLAETDYDWLKTIAEKHNQENMLMSVNNRILQPVDQARYAEKLLAEGNEVILRRMISKEGSFSLGALPPEMFWDLTKNGESVEPRYFADLDSNCLQLFLSKFTNEDKQVINFRRDKAIRENIKFFNLKDGLIEDNEKFLAYQELVEDINATFGKDKPSDEIYKSLIIGFSSFGSAEEIRQRAQDLTTKLNIVAENTIILGLSTVLSSGFDKLLDQDLDALREDADSLRRIISNNALISVDNIKLLHGCAPAEKEAMINLLQLKSLPLNRLLEKIKSASLPDGELADILAKDFAIDVSQLAQNNQADFSGILNALTQAWYENRGTHNNIKPKRDQILMGKHQPVNNDSLIRLSRDYQVKGAFKDELCEFDFHDFSDKLGPDFNQENWAGALTAYIIATEEEEYRIDKGKKEIIETEFSGSYRDLCLNAMSTEWRDFLSNKQGEELPFKLLSLSETINHYGGAGNLSRIEALSGLIHSLADAAENKKVVPRTFEEIKGLLSQQEVRFEKENWSQDDKAEFHNLAKEIIEAAPSLFSAFAPIFEKMSPKETKIFVKELLPLYQINLITVQSAPDDEGNVSYEPRDLVAIRSSVKRLAATMNAAPEVKLQEMSLEKDRLSSTMRANFKNRLGLENVPKQIDKEGLRLLHNFIRYTGNISDRDAKKEAEISLFLALNINGDWENFRKGEEINPSDYLAKDKAEKLNDVMQGREKNKLTAEMVGIKEEQLGGFQDKLQAETRNSMMGNVETVDVKLNMLKRNVDDLLDPDAYEAAEDKALLNILGKYHKETGSALAKIFQELSGRNVVMTKAEEEAAQELASAFQVRAWSREQVKAIQERMQPISLINNLSKKLQDNGLESSIQELNTLLSPDRKVIEIFNKLDENFKTGSGAIALSKDLEYLDNLLVKEKSKLSELEVAAASDYLTAIRKKVSELEGVMMSAKEYFNKVKSSIHASGQQNKILAERLQEVEAIINNREHDSMIVSEMTKDFSLIIENMRQCLGCLRKEINNDTNLAFGDYNKFFLVTKKEKASGSVADEIVFLLPVTKPDNSKDMSFVMDRVYGKTSPDILLAHFLTVYKKYESLKHNFKEAKLSIAITQEALTSAGITADNFKARILEKAPNLEINFISSGLSAEVPTSSFSDNYIEFGTGGGARGTGARTFSALMVE